MGSALTRPSWCCNMPRGNGTQGGDHAGNICAPLAATTLHAHSLRSSVIKRRCWRRKPALGVGSEKWVPRRTCLQSAPWCFAVLGGDATKTFMHVNLLAIYSAPSHEPRLNSPPWAWAERSASRGARACAARRTAPARPARSAPPPSPPSRCRSAGRTGARSPAGFERAGEGRSGTQFGA